jgi:hypothetical protein
VLGCQDFVAVDAVASTSNDASVPYHPSRLCHPYAAGVATGEEAETLYYRDFFIYVQYNLGLGEGGFSNLNMYIVMQKGFRSPY